MFGLGLSLHVVEWEEKALLFSTTLVLDLGSAACTECERGYVLKMTCNPIQAPQFLPDGTPSPAPVVFIFDNMLKHISSLQRATSSAGSSSTCNAGVAEPGALAQRRTCIFSMVVSCGEQTTGFHNNKLYQLSCTGPECSELGTLIMLHHCDYTFIPKHKWMEVQNFYLSRL